MLFLSFIILIIYLLVIFFAIFSSFNFQVLKNIFFSAEILFAVKFTLVTATISTLIAFTLAVFIGFYLSRKNFKFKPILEIILDLPLILPPISLGIILLLFFNTSLGRFIEKLGLVFVFNPSGVMLAQFFVIFAVMIKLCKTSFDAVDIKNDLMAYSLGLNWRENLTKIIIPLAYFDLITSFLICWMKAAGEFGATVVFAGAIKQKTETLSIAMFLNLSSAEINKVVAIIILLILLALIFTLIIKYLTCKNSLFIKNVSRY